MDITILLNVMVLLIGVMIGIEIHRLLLRWRGKYHYFCPNCEYKISLPLKSIYCEDCGCELDVERCEEKKKDSTRESKKDEEKG